MAGKEQVTAMNRCISTSRDFPKRITSRATFNNPAVLHEQRAIVFWKFLWGTWS